MSDFEQIEVLLAEDTPSDAEMAMRAFRKNNFSGRIHWVKDGEEALEYVRCTGRYSGRDTDKPPRLMLLDLKMPKLDGIDVLRTVKNDPQYRSIPVVIMTSSSEERDIAESYRQGVNSYIVKPVDFEKFVRMVGEVGSYWMLTNRVPDQVL